MSQPIPMKEFFIFTTVVDGIELVAMHPIDRVPLMYLQRRGIEGDDMIEYLQRIADANGITFELKHFTYVDRLEIIEPMKSRVTQ